MSLSWSGARRAAAAGLATAMLAACGVPQGKYQAALAEASRSIKQVAEERQRAEAAEKRAAELDARLAAAEQRSRDLSTRLGERERPPAPAAEPAQPREPPAPAAAVRGEAIPRSVEPWSVEHEALAASLEQEIRAGRIQLLQAGGLLTVRFAERVLFLTGSAAVSSDGRRALRLVAEVLRTARGRPVRVEAHTDDIPIRTDAFPSNWELSTARATAVVQLLQGLGINPALLGGTGYADAQPIATNRTSEGRAQNRRLEVTLLPAAGPTPDRPPARAPMIFPITPTTGDGALPPGT